MLGEISAVLLAFIGGIAAVFDETWNKKKRHPTLTGWITICVVVAASVSAFVQIWNTERANTLREERETRMSYEAYISVYGPLSRWFDDFALYDGALDDSVDYAFPPPTSGEQYQRLRESKCRRDGYTDFLAVGVHIENRPYRNDLAESFAGRYRLVQLQLDNAIIAYGPEISDEMLEHFVSLKAHSLFREADERQLRRDKACTGWIDQVAMDFTNGDLEPTLRARCRTIFANLLSKATSDALPVFQLPDEFEDLHKARCEIVGYKRPYCRWGSLNTSQRTVSEDSQADPECLKRSKGRNQ